MSQGYCRRTHDLGAARGVCPLAWFGAHVVASRGMCPLAWFDAHVVASRGMCPLAWFDAHGRHARVWPHAWFDAHVVAKRGGCPLAWLDANVGTARSGYLLARFGVPADLEMIGGTRDRQGPAVV
jgi:hypothetical protein